MNRLIIRVGPKLSKYYVLIMSAAAFFHMFILSVSATDGGGDMWATADRIIRDVYNHIAAISTVLAGLMSAIAVIGAKLSNNQHKVDQSWDWLKRVWLAWAIINGIGAFIAYIRPLFEGMNTLDGTTPPTTP